MKFIVTMFVMLAACLEPLFAQSTALNAKDIELSWTVAEYRYKNKNEARCVVDLKNKGQVPMPATGWKIYFNISSVRNLDTADKALTVKHINGDLFCMQPGKNFAQIDPGKSMITQVITGAQKNQSDLPEGFYIVFDNKPSKGFAIKVNNILEVEHTQDEIKLAEKIFQQNKLSKNLPLSALPPVLPTPLKYAWLKGTFSLSQSVSIAGKNVFGAEADYLSAELKGLLTPSAATKAAGKTKSIVLNKKPDMAPEAYELVVTPDRITISASNSAGIFHGMQSLKMLLPPASWSKKQKTINVPCVSITDAPRFSHRAFMMDVARNFQQKSYILKVIDLLALYKFNVLHMHLNDDEGWRLQIPGLPELTTVGSTRGHSIDERDRLLPSYGSGPDATNAAGTGYYTREDFVDILRYAKTRHIMVIPEIETPGHARAAIKSMTSRYHRLMKEGNKLEAEKYLLYDLNDSSKYRSVQGFNDNVINPTLPSVYTFLNKVTDEIIGMYKAAGAPLQTIHFGGDEVPAGVWERSPVVAKLLQQDTSVKSTDELWYYYFNKVNNMLKERKLYLSGWEEIGERKALVSGRKTMVMDPRFAKANFHVDVWNNLTGNEDLAYKMANEGYKVVLTNVTNLYLDLSYNQSIDETGQYWGGYVDLNKPFDFIPFNYYKTQKEDEYGKPRTPEYYNGKVQLTEEGKANIIGIQAPLWSEVLTSALKHEYLLLPKLFSVAERAWAADPQWATEPDAAKSTALYHDAWSVFVNKVAHAELPRLDHYAGGFNYRIPTAGFQVNNNTIDANVQFPGLVVRYTTDGTQPNMKSKQFTGPVKFDENMCLRVFNKKGLGGRTVKVSGMSK